MDKDYELVVIVPESEPIIESLWPVIEKAVDDWAEREHPARTWDVLIAGRPSSHQIQPSAEDGDVWTSVGIFAAVMVLIGVAWWSFGFREALFCFVCAVFSMTGTVFMFSTEARKLLAANRLLRKMLDEQSGEREGETL